MNIFTARSSSITIVSMQTDAGNSICAVINTAGHSVFTAEAMTAEMAVRVTDHTNAENLIFLRMYATIALITITALRTVLCIPLSLLRLILIHEGLLQEKAAEWMTENLKLLIQLFLPE